MLVSIAEFVGVIERPGVADSNIGKWRDGGYGVY